jgi:ATP-dependent DNA helicase RecG
MIYSIILANEEDEPTRKHRYGHCTLAAVLLLGNDEVIQSIAPQYRTDAILRKIDIDR